MIPSWLAVLVICAPAGGAEVQDLSLVLDKTTRRGEITFSGGRVKDGEVEYRRWKASGLERYVEAAAGQGILFPDWKERLGSRLDGKPYRRGVDLAARIVLLMGARDLIDHRIQEMIPPVSDPGRSKDEAAIERHLGARRLVKRELGKAISDCREAVSRLEIRILRCPGEPPGPKASPDRAGGARAPPSTAPPRSKP